MSHSGYRRVRVRRRKRFNPFRQLIALPLLLSGSSSRRRRRQRRSRSPRGLFSGPRALIQRLRRQSAPHPSRLEHPSSFRHHRRRGVLGLPAVVRRGLLLPLMELLEAVVMLTAPLWRHPIVSVPLGMAGLWLAWPALAPLFLPLLGPFHSAGPRIPPPDVISVFVEDHQRSIWALDLWKNRPGALLVMQGRPSSQRANVIYLRSRGLWPENEARLLTLEPGCDTVGQVAALAGLLQQQPRPGRVTMVTSNAHLPRTLAIARTVLGPMGWRVEGLPVVTQDNRPESVQRLIRDQLRAQLLRFTGLTGSRSDQSCA